MEAEIKKTEKPVLKKIAERLLAAQQEVDELAVQFALGKAEAKDKFEEVKKELRANVSDLKRTFMTQTLNNVIVSLKAKFEELEVQLALGKADTADVFEAQSKRILQAVKSLEREIKSKLPDHREANVFSQEVEKFKLKIEILRLKFMLKQFEVQDAFRDKMKDARKAIDNFKHAVAAKTDTVTLSHDVNEEVQRVYKLLRQALASLKKPSFNR